MNRLYELALILVLSLLGVFLQGTFLGLLLPSFLIPDLLIVLIVYLAFYQPNSWGVTLAFLIGFILDLSSGLLLGPWAGSYVIVFSIFASLSQRIFVSSFFAAFLAVFASRIMASALYFIIVQGFLSSATGDLAVSISHALVSGACAPFVLSFYRKVFRRLQTDPRGGAYSS